MTTAVDSELDAMPAEHEPPAAERPGIAARMAARRLDAALAFDQLDGPLVAVCGLAGGAGTTTLAWLLAHGAARASEAPVLLCELPSCSGGLEAIGGLQGAGSLGRMAALSAAGRASRPLVVPGPDGLRVLASPPEHPPSRPEADDLDAALADVLDDARTAHGLVVVDCGRLHAPDAQAALAVATHVIWTLPGGPHAGERARALLEGALAPPLGGAPEVLVVSSPRPARTPPPGQRSLRKLSRERCERLVLIPYADALAAGRLEPDSWRLATALTAIAGVLQTPTTRGDLDA